MVAPSTSTLLTQWSWQPSILAGVALVSAAYVYALGPYRERHGLEPATRAQIIAFVLAQLTLIVALLSPIDAISDTYLFSVHMVQHLLLATLWPPLMLLAVPAWLARRILRVPVLSGFVRFFVHPFVAMMLFNLDIYLWHIPPLYDLTLSNEPVHILEHLSFMMFGLFVWWPVLAPNHEDRLSFPLQTLYLLLNAMFMMGLGILFTFAPSPFYSAYTTVPRLWGISASTDQQIGGLIMWYPGNIPYAVLMVVRFYQWFDGADPGRMEREAQSHTIESPSTETSL